MARKQTRDAIYQFLMEFIQDHGYGPTVREICAGVGLRSTGTVHYHLREMVKSGRILMDESKKRAISLPSGPAVARIPVVGTVAAGTPILAVENLEGYLPWPDGEGMFALRVQGQSMKNAGILPGDLVVVRPQATADPGQIIVALLEDEATVKRFWIEDGHVWLLPENEDFDPIEADEAVILGVVKGVVRQY